MYIIVRYVDFHLSRAPNLTKMIFATRILGLVLILIFLIDIFSRPVDAARRRKAKVGGNGSGNGARGEGSFKTQRLLLEAWATSLTTDKDYNGTYQWRRTFHSVSASTFFDEYNLRFSNLASSKNAVVYFASLGK